MTRDELKEKVATAIMSRFVKPDMHETVTWADGSKQWRVDHFGEMAEAALSAIEASGMAVVPVEATAQPVSAGVRHRLETTIDGANNWPLDTAALYRAMIEAGRLK